MLTPHNETIVGEGFLLLSVLVIALFPETAYYTFSVADPTDHGLKWYEEYMACNAGSMKITYLCFFKKIQKNTFH